MLLVLGRRITGCIDPSFSSHIYITDQVFQMLQQIGLQDSNATRRHLLEKTQHLIGGFGKTCGDPPGLIL